MIYTTLFRCRLLCTVYGVQSTVYSDEGDDGDTEAHYCEVVFVQVSLPFFSSELSFLT